MTTIDLIGKALRLLQRRNRNGDLDYLVHALWMIHAHLVIREACRLAARSKADTDWILAQLGRVGQSWSIS